eukprot:4454729-Pyramimonas_sp.AAC.1
MHATGLRALLSAGFHRRGYIPTGRTNRTRGEGIYPQGGPIGRGERVYTHRATSPLERRFSPPRASASRARGFIPTGRTNQTRGEGIYPQGGPIGRGARVYTYRADRSDEGRGAHRAIQKHYRHSVSSWLRSR